MHPRQREIELTPAAEPLASLERPLKPVFIVPGTTPASATLGHARALIRRAERHFIRTTRADRPISADVVTFLNRASDLAYVLGRHAVGDADPTPSLD